LIEGLLVFFVMLGFLHKETAVREEQVHPSLRRHDPDYIVDNFRSLSYDARGAIESALSARKMVHYPEAPWSGIRARTAGLASAHLYGMFPCQMAPM